MADTTGLEGQGGRSSRRSSIRRNFSLSINARPFRHTASHSVSSVPSTPKTAQPASQTPPHQRSRSGTSPIFRQSTDSSYPGFDPPALHYRDPEARKTLRQYLASPQNFDEAVEFGFPSRQSTDPLSDFGQKRCKTAHGDGKNHIQTFLQEGRGDAVNKDDQNSVEEGDEDSSVDGRDSPITPADIPTSLFSSLDSTNLPPLNLTQFSDFFGPNSAAAREMTLRMTLTRPDLRADEDALYGWKPQLNSEPLPLEELPELSDDLTGANGAFAVKGHRQSGIFKKLLSKMSRQWH